MTINIKQATGMGALDAVRRGRRWSVEAAEETSERAASLLATRGRDVVHPAASSLPALAAKPSGPKPTGDRAAVKAARRLNRAAGTLALSVLADSAVEHYRGSFENKAMYTPLAVATLCLAASAHGTTDRRGKAHPVRDNLRAGGRDRLGWHGVPPLQHRQAGRRVLLA